MRTRGKALLMMTMVAALAIATGAGAGQWTLEVEGGAVWQTVNDNQIPNTDEGTRFSLVDLAGKGPQAAYRVYLDWDINAKHSLRGMFAPLEIDEPGTLAGPLLFNGETFAAGAAEATYRFNSYRLTYAYSLHRGRTWDWDLGFTAKIRDARVQIRQGDLVSTKDNVGFVPLLHVAGHARLGDGWHFLLDLDALAGGPGRAEDLSLKLGYDLSERLQLRLGYRTVEGGADVEEVYSFAWLHYAVGSVFWRF